MGTTRQFDIVANRREKYPADSNENRVDVRVNAIAATLSPVVYRNIRCFITVWKNLPY